MVLSSTQHIQLGEPLLLSYFEGSNDEFLLHYGFVPDSNPHDSVRLFGNISEALEHLWWQDKAQVGLGRVLLGILVWYQLLSSSVVSSTGIVFLVSRCGCCTAAC